MTHPKVVSGAVKSAKPKPRKATRTPRLITLDEAAIALQWFESIAFGSPVANDRKQARTVIGLIRGLERCLDSEAAHV